MHDMIVIGAGPVGSYLASLCSGDMRVMLIDKKFVPGNKACSGLVSGRIRRLLPGHVIETPGVIQHKVLGSVMHFMGNEIRLRKKKAAAYVIDRDLLDKRMAEHASLSGCEVRFGVKAEDVRVLASKARISTNKGIFDSSLLAGCGGANSITARHIGANAPELMNGLVLRVEREDYSDHVEMWFDKRHAPGGFMWRIPRGLGLEYGGMGKGLTFKAVERFFKLKNGEVSKKEAAPIPIGIVPTFSDRILLVGDSACQTKPWSGGGVTYGLLAAEAAAGVIKEAFRGKEFSAQYLAAYESAWKKVLLKDIQAGLVFREMYSDLPGQELSKLAEKMASIKGMESKADFDFPFSSMFEDMGDAFAH